MARPALQPLALILLLATAQLPASGQFQPGPNHRISGILRSDGGRPLDSATLRFFPSETPPLCALRSWPTAAGTITRPISGQTRSGGRFQLRVPSAHGALLALEPDPAAAVLGALRLGAQPIATIDCSPLAQLSFRAASEVWIQAISARGESFQLGHHREVKQLRLPAGRYRFLVRQGSSLRQFRCRLRSGERAQAKAVAEDQRQASLESGGLRVTLRDWPGVDLPSRDRRVTLPSGAPLRLLLRQSIPGGEWLTEHWVDSAATTLQASKLPTRALQIRDSTGAPLANAQLATAQPSPRGWSIRSISRTDRLGKATIPDRLDSAWVFAWAPDHAASATRLDTTPAILDLRAAASAQLQLLDPRGEPLAGALVEIVPSAAELRSQHRTDYLGQIHLAHLAAGEIQIHLRDPRYRRTTAAMVLRPATRNRQTLIARDGARLHGTVHLPGGQAASGAVVRIEDPGSGPPTEQWSVITGADGSFQVFGLAEDTPVRISATLTHDGASFISGNHAVTPGETAWIVELRSEDPALPGQRK